MQINNNTNQQTPFTDISISDDLVSAQKHQIITPVIPYHEVKLQDSLISANAQFIAIIFNIYPKLKEECYFSIIQLYNVITGQQCYSKKLDSRGSHVSAQFSFDSSILVVFDFGKVIIFNVEEKNSISIIKMESECYSFTIDSDNNIILPSSNNQLIVYSTKNANQQTLQFDRKVDHFQKLGANNAIYICGCNQYLLNLQNNKILKRWMNHEFDMRDQIIYKKLLMIQAWGDKLRQAYVKLQQSGRIIRKYIRSSIQQEYVRITEEKSSVSIQQFLICRIKQPILNAIKSIFKIQMIVIKFDFLTGRQRKYYFKIDQDPKRQIPIYMLQDNQLKYYLFQF